MTGKRAASLRVRLRGRDVELTCACGFMLTQPLRATIEDRCPRCRRR
jgi:hypothetical protein